MKIIILAFFCVWLIWLSIIFLRFVHSFFGCISSLLRLHFIDKLQFIFLFKEKKVGLFPVWARSCRAGRSGYPSQVQVPTVWVMRDHTTAHRK